MFFSGLNSENNFIEKIVPICNNLIGLERVNEFCCEKKIVNMGGENIESSCFELRTSYFVEGIREFDCNGIVC